MKAQLTWVWVLATLAGCGSTDLVHPDDSSREAASTTLLGCFKDEATRDLSHVVTLDSPTNATESCINACANAGYAYAGAQYSTQCFCGDTYGRYGQATDCTIKCSGNAAEVCGGIWANSVYETGLQHYVELAWVAPTTLQGGSALTDLAGFKLYQGAASGAYGPGEDLGLLGCSASGSACSPSYRVAGLAAGTWYFAVTAYDSTGVESVLSAPASTVMP